ncbi:DUF6188 family protein [Allorhizocola rhizosphaerae]|uniref:DUF6188 family protein n=1 Tax=Allorhizocola rhizosphaerae TaxID=1872709 RepID=UPI003CCC510D
MDLEIDSEGKLPLPLSNCDVAMLRIDYALTFVIGHVMGTFELRISSDFSYYSQTGRVNLDPEDRPEELGPIIHLARSCIVSANASSGGSLSISFADGSWIDVPASEEFEAWQLSGPGGLRVISVPGGELAVWRHRL